MKKLTADEFIKKCSVRHNSKYCYSNANYNGLQSFIKVSCPTHGLFEIKSQNHLYKGGCPACARVTTGAKNSARYSKNTLWFLEQIKEVHGTKYDYSKTEYTKMNNCITIICRHHGAFIQLAQSHVRGSGCPRCAKAGRSKGQDNWLDSLGIPDDQFHRNVRVAFPDGTWLRADGFMNNTFYEFWGDWAHGNPKFYNPSELNVKFKKTYGELFQLTTKKISKISDAGFTLIDIWEHQWLQDSKHRLSGAL